MNGVTRKVAQTLVAIATFAWAAQAYAITPPIGYVNYNPVGTIEAARKDPTKALVYDENFDDQALPGGGYNFVSLGFGGSITLTVLDGYSIANGEGYDFKLFETTYGDYPDNWETYKESALVYAFDSAANGWYELGLAKLDGEFDLGNLFSTTAIKIVDVSNPADFKGAADGYDIDGIVIRNVGNPVPVPGAVWLLGSAMLGLVGLRRIRTV